MIVLSHSQLNQLFHDMRMVTSDFYVDEANPEDAPLVSSIQVSSNNFLLHVRAEFHGHENYARGKELLGEATYFDLEDNLFGNNRYTMSLATNNKRLILFFISELYQISPGFSHSRLEQKLQQHHLMMSQAYRSRDEIPVWDVRFGRDQTWAHMSTTYRNTSPQSKVRTLRVIHGSNPNALNITVDFSSRVHYQNFLSSLAAINLTDIENPLMRDAILISAQRNNPASMERLRLFIDQIRLFEALITNDIHRKISQGINGPSSTNAPDRTHDVNTTASYLPSRSVSHQLPDSGMNARALENSDADVPDRSLKDECESFVALHKVRPTQKHS